MTIMHDPEGYRNGRTEGYQKGREEGFRKGLQAARDARSLPPAAPPLGEISLRWRELGCAERIGACMGSRIVLRDHEMACLKETINSAVWQLAIERDGRTEPLILKIFKAPITGSDLVELSMYRYATPLLGELMPEIYLVEMPSEGGEAWVFMEYVPQLKGQLIFTPDHFERIVPPLARLHALTHNERLAPYRQQFAEWLPIYTSEQGIADRKRVNEEMLVYLDQAMEQPALAERLKADEAMLRKVLAKGPDYFPELLGAGLSITHNDLQTPNIGCYDAAGAEWRIKLLDWEGARFAPCWFDLFNLIGVFFAYRRDWRKDEEVVSERISRLYASEMERHGILFKEDPVRLYKMAYVQRVLERSLHLQLQWGVHGTKPARLLENYVDKIRTWGRELGL
ncbi:phosphotransferase [Paenibacillus sp. 598K]|uniref:phosphotransferase n=1 Tax=Paenibacillus sp. 598K TaxID=1117987 RepID=UPI000FFE51D8|nr:phosphotransferase [Paenibacillus sp. 598K]